MTDQKFFKGDRVFVRGFDEIDTGDIGVITKGRRFCYGITRKEIERTAGFGELEIENVIRDLGTYIYTLRNPISTKSVSFLWAQGMLRPVPEEELAEPDPTDLFRFFADE